MKLKMLFLITISRVSRKRLDGKFGGSSFSLISRKFAMDFMLVSVLMLVYITGELMCYWHLNTSTDDFTKITSLFIQCLLIKILSKNQQRYPYEHFWKPCSGQTGYHSLYPALSASYPFLNYLFSFKFSFIAKQISYQL